MIDIKFINRQYTLWVSSICIISLFFCSCSDFLSEDPESDVSDETYWNTEDDGNSAIVGCYAQLRKALNNGIAYYAYGDLCTDIFTSERDITPVHYNNVQDGDWGISVSSSETSAIMYRLRTFEKFYSAIRQANLCLAKIPNIPKDQYSDYDFTYKQFMGEAYFVRAFSYFYMAHVWGDVPIVDDNVVDEVDLTNYSRDNEDKVLAKAIEDCKTAISLLSWNYTDEDDKVVRANKGAAWSLLAHIYAWQGNYEACESAAKKVTEQGYYTYLDRNNYLEIFEGQSDESIFEIAQNDESEGSDVSSSISGMLLRDDYYSLIEDNTNWPFDTLTLRQTLFYDKSDLRRINGFWEFSDDYPVLLKYSNINVKSSTYALSYNNILVYRLSGIALLQAEAQAAQGKYVEARTILNKIRSLADLEESTAPNDELFEAIIEERGRELFMEGHRFYDLVRLAREKGVYKFGSSNSDKITEKEFKEGKSYWPIQPTLLEENPLLTQTEYWKSEME